MAVSDLLRPARYTDAATQRRRAVICATCPNKTILNRCKKCGCFVALKTKLKTEKCPEGKWV